MPFIVGLTGGIASGKSTVANLFQQHFNIGIVDADVIAREVVKPDTTGLAKIVEHFGEQIIDSSGQLKRAALRERIFSNPDEKKWLNELLHPMIRNRMKQDLNQITTPYALLVVPLMVENRLLSMTNRVLVVDVSEQVQLNRTMKRDNVSEQQVKSILASQASREQRLRYADDVILNDGSTALLPQITALHNKYMLLSSSVG